MTGQPKRTTLIIGKDGSVRGVYDPLVNAIAAELGTPTIRRASHVEPGAGLSQAALRRLQETTPTMVQPGTLAEPAGTLHIIPELQFKWWADLTPVRGPVLGPYESRDTALRCEAEWLLLYQIPMPDTPTD